MPTAKPGLKAFPIALSKACFSALQRAVGKAPPSMIPQKPARPNSPSFCEKNHRNSKFAVPQSFFWRPRQASPMMSVISMRAQPSFRPPEFTLGTFGEKLRKQREQRGISLDAISTITKISTRMLRAIEDEHFDQLPGGVFSKGFVRAYARQVGLNEEEAVADYLTALRENQIQSQTVYPNFGSVAGKSATDRAELDHRNPDRDNGVRGSDFKSSDLGRTPNGGLYHNDVAGGLQSRPRRTDDRRKDVRRSGDREVDLNQAVGHQVQSHEDFAEERRLSKGLLGKDLPGKDLPGNDLLR